VIRRFVTLTESWNQQRSGRKEEPMLYPVIKFALSAAIIVAVSEVSKRSTLAGSLLVSLPLVSLLAMVWLWLDTRDVQKISALSTGIFWLVLPSLLLFISLPQLLRRGMTFPLALGASILIMLAGYGLMLLALGRIGVKL
jgi:hypothetical protein